MEQFILRLINMRVLVKMKRKTNLKEKFLIKKIKNNFKKILSKCHKKLEQLNNQRLGIRINSIFLVI